MDYSPERIQAILDKQPQEIKDLFFSTKTVRTIQDVAQKNGLFEDEISTLLDQTGLVILGLIPKEKFLSTLEEKVPIETEILQKIVQEIEKNIFSLIKNPSPEQALEGGVAFPKKQEDLPPSHEILKEIEDKEAPGTPAPEEPSKNLLVRKLEDVATLQKQETKVSAPAAPPASKKIDPYREPIG